MHELTTANSKTLEYLLATWHRLRLPLLVVIIGTIFALRIAASFERRRKARLILQSSKEPPISSSHDSEKVQILHLESENQSVVETDEPSFGNEPKSNITLLRTSGNPRRVVGSKARLRTQNDNINLESESEKLQILIFYSSLSGTTERAALRLAEELRIPNVDERRYLQFLAPVVHDLSYIDYDEYFVSAPGQGTDTVYFYLVLVPTYNIDTVLNNFLEHLQDTHHDFRLNTASLSGIVGYSVFGFGDREGWPSEEEGFCSQAREIDRWLAKLTGRKRAFPVGMGDAKTDAEERLREWREGVQDVICDVLSGKGFGEGVPGSGNAIESDQEDLEDDEQDDSDRGGPRTVSKSRKFSKNERLDDVEDLGRMVSVQERADSSTPGLGDFATDFTTHKTTRTSQAQQLREMVPQSSPTYAALTKQGYTIVGSHSGVKICRWTKSALRGRGSCYKFSFYGIKSHLCMETTPSLSCSNKCVFCWRHGTNPVGTTWRWQVDPPEKIFAGVTEGHYKKIKMLKGVPGVRAERFAEAMRIRHCALSLVGEPIFYPYINEFVALLHAEHISSFLVCNAQHPDQLAALKPVTQLYVSIDASNKESLRKIDRPLHRDFWERFCRCLDILREKRFRQRTVFRLTLVKGFNIEDEVDGYADLVARGLPCFVEVKGVTYCGTSSSSAAGLTMQNVPFYAEVCTFVEALTEALRKRGLDYGIAAEHAHSCCVLIASSRFRRDGKWCTVIDYERFFECLESGKEFAPEDYMGPPTPEWALWGNGGFDPADTRVYRKGKKDSQKANE